MKLPEGLKVRLDPEDEYTHTPEDVANYNESMYFNMFDFNQKVGGWFRLGNRPNEKYAEMSVCLYLPDGRIGFMFGRPTIDNNDAMDAGGLKIEVNEPFKKLTLTYEGKVLLLDQPKQMADPRTAFRENPSVSAKVTLNYRGVSPMYGGETVHADGSPMELDAEKSFARAHYEQHMAADGVIEVNGETFNVSGYGLRDKSWGPRHWQSLYWYRWCPIAFGEDFGMMVSVIQRGPDEEPRVSGMVLSDGAYHQITDGHINANFDDDDCQTDLELLAITEDGERYEVTGDVLSLIPLRNRRKTPDGDELMTRITEGMTEYKCGDRVGYGLSEFLDQIVDGKAVSLT